RFFEPAVVGDIDDDLWPRTNEFPGKARHGILETNRRNRTKPEAMGEHFDRLEGFTGTKRPPIFRSGLLFVDFSEKRHGIHERNGFAEDHQVTFAKGFELIIRGHESD